MADPSFDVVSKVEHGRKSTTRSNQASQGDVATRYDFRGNTGAAIEWSGEDIVTIVAERG